MTTTSTNFDATYAKTSEETWAPILKIQTGVEVSIRGKRLECFHERKAAGAWILHVYGVRMSSQEAKDLGIEVKPLKTREPQPGDALIYDGSGDFYHAGRGVLEMLCGSLAVCFSASAFRDDRSVSCSGGPVPWVNPEDLEFAGLYQQTFWRWHDGSAGASQGGSYQITVPLWRWNGNPVKFEDD